MIRQLVLIIVCALSNMLANAAALSLNKDVMTREQTAYPDFHSWAAACDTLPFFKYFTNVAEIKHILTYDEFLKILNIFINSHQNDHFKDRNFWLSLPEDTTHLDNYFFNPYTCQPYVQKHIIPAGKKIIFKGDLHADIHSLIKFIRTLTQDGLMSAEDPFKIISDSLHIIFLGDYTDKGIFGIEVLYTILRLKLANTDRVFLVRGNHEDATQNFTGGLFTELMLKLANKQPEDKSCIFLFKRIMQMYNFLPACLFLGIQSEQGFIHYIQCCHGGMELGHNAKAFLDNSNVLFEMITHVKRLENCHDFPCLAENGLNLKDINIRHADGFSNIGYMWSDFSISETNTMKGSKRGENIYVYGKLLTQELLKKLTGETFRVCAVMRAHQHNCKWTDLMELILDRYNQHPEDIGCGKLWRTDDLTSSFWDGIVCTLMLSPDNVLGGGDEKADFPQNMFDYWAILQTANNFSDWKLTMSKNNPYEK